MKPSADEFQKLVLQELDTLYRIGLRLTHNPADAEDLVQDTCFRAIRSRDTFDMQAGGIRPWLVRILRNCFLTRLQKQSRQPVGTDEQILEAVSQAPDVSPTGPMEVLREGMDEELVRALDALPEEYRTVMVLWALEDFSYQEIADACQIPIGTVMSRLHRARGKMTEMLRQYARNEGIIRE